MRQNSHDKIFQRETRRAQNVTYWYIMTIALFISSAAFGQTGSGQPFAPSALQQISLTVGIPATIIGAAYSWVLISKTRVETKKADIDTEKARHEIEKIKLERQKLERELSAATPADEFDITTVKSVVNDKTSELISSMNERSSRNQKATSLILRFVVLGLFQSFAYTILNPAIIVGSVMRDYIRNYGRLFLYPYSDVIADIILYAPQVMIMLIQGIIIILVGIPLLRDLNQFLGIEMPKFRLSKGRSQRSN